MDNRETKPRGPRKEGAPLRLGRSGTVFSAGALAVAALTLAFGGSGSASNAATAADPIVGDWNYAGGVVRVTGSGTRFTGTVVTATKISSAWRECPHPVGQEIWNFHRESHPGQPTYWGQMRTATDLATGHCPSSPSSYPLGVTGFWRFFGGQTAVLTMYGGWVERMSGKPTVSLTRATPVKPEPKPQPPAAGKLVVQLLELPERYGLDEDGNGLIDQFLTPKRINPGVWPARLLVRRADYGKCDPGAIYRWKVDRQVANLARDKEACVFSYAFKGLGKHQVEVSAVLPNGATEKGAGAITLRDFLVVGIGDSVGSGEGNPDIGAWGFSPTWLDRRCDRSHHSYQPWVAGWLADTSYRTSVTFVHLACSGAKVSTGLLAPYGGLNDPGGAKLPAQVTQLTHLLKASKRMPDAVLLSVGANDLGFGPIVGFCIQRSSCWDEPGFDRPHLAKRLEDVVKTSVGMLPVRYKLLDGALRRAGIPASRVYITQYFDPTRNGGGAFCHPTMLDVSPLVGLIGEEYGEITATEARWAYEDVITPLNNAVAKAADDYGWNLVGGIAGKFRTHGYCSGSRTWIVQLSEAAWSQGGGPEFIKKKVPGFWWLDAPIAEAGALHPNKEGHKAIALSVIERLKANGIDGQLEK